MISTSRRPVRRRWTVARTLILMATLAALAATSRADWEGFGTGLRVAGLGDVTGDGDPDFATMQRGRTDEITIVSTASTSAVWSVTGCDAAAVPDQDGDGLPDVVIVSRAHRSRKWAVICKGTSGTPLSTLIPKNPDGTPYETTEDAHSESVSLFGDVTGDGEPELLIVRVVPRAGYSSINWCSSAWGCVVSLDGTVVMKFAAQADPGDRSLVAGPAGDANGDGRPDAFVCVDAERGRLPLQIRSIANEEILGFKGASLGSPPRACARGAACERGTRSRSAPSAIWRTAAHSTERCWSTWGCRHQSSRAWSINYTGRSARWSRDACAKQNESRRITARFTLERGRGAPESRCRRPRGVRRNDAPEPARPRRDLWSP